MVYSMMELFLNSVILVILWCHKPPHPMRVTCSCTSLAIPLAQNAKQKREHCHLLTNSLILPKSLCDGAAPVRTILHPARDFWLLKFSGKGNTAGMPQQVQWGNSVPVMIHAG